MTISNLLNVNPILVDRVRLAIMVNLMVADGPVDFNTLLLELELTKGNLSTHMKKLEAAALIEINKEFVERKPRTTYLCTNEGKKELRQYLGNLESILSKTSV